MILTTQEIDSKTAKGAKGDREGELAKEGEHLLRVPQGQLHPNNSGEHEPELGQLVAQVDGVERAEQLGVVDGEEEGGAGETQGKTAEAKVAKQNKTRQGGGTSRGARPIKPST